MSRAHVSLQLMPINSLILETVNYPNIAMDLMTLLYYCYHVSGREDDVYTIKLLRSNHDIRLGW